MSLIITPRGYKSKHEGEFLPTVIVTGLSEKTVRDILGLKPIKKQWRALLTLNRGQHITRSSALANLPDGYEIEIVAVG